MSIRPICAAWLALLVSALAIIGAAASGTSPAAAATPPCTDVEIVGLRGSSEPFDPAQHGMGALLGTEADLVAAQAPTGTAVGFHGIGYPAVSAVLGVIDGDYFSSKEEGMRELDGYLRQEIQACPDTRLVVMGYSQGAHAAGDQLAQEPASVTDHVAELVMFGDPRFNPDATYARGTFDPDDEGLAGARPLSDFGSWSTRVASFCNRDDLVCQGVGFGHGTAAHDQALYLSSYGAFAAGLVRTQLGWPYNGRPNAPVDVAFVIDSTGSMYDNIQAARDAATGVTKSLQDRGIDFRVGLVDYKDTDQDDPYASRVDLDMTSDGAALGRALDALSVQGGGDTPEAAWSGLMTAFGHLRWRPIPRKAVILMGDAPAKDPEPVTGFTLAGVLDAARELDPATIYPVAVGDDPVDSFAPLAAGSGGRLFEALDASQVTEQIVAAVEEAAVPIYTSLTVTTPARPGTRVVFSAAGSYYDPGPITAYDWDFDGDGITDETTTGSRTTHVYAEPFDGIASVTVRTEDGHSAAATTKVDVRTGAPVAPGPPADLAVTATSDTLNAAWHAPANVGGGRLAGYTVRVDDAATGEPVRAVATDMTSAAFAGLVPGAYLLSVRAVTEAGAGPAVSRAVELRRAQTPSPRGNPVAAQPAAQPKQAISRRRPAGLRIVRATIRRGRLRVLARIAREATGTVRVTYRAAGRTVAFGTTIRNGTIRFRHRIPARRRTRHARLSLSYAGTATLLPAAVKVSPRTRSCCDSSRSR